MTLETRLVALAPKIVGHPSMKPDLAPLLALQDEASAKCTG